MWIWRIKMEQLTIDDITPKQNRKRKFDKLKVFELFAGYGSQSLALKRYNIPFESVGYCEIDKYAIQAYKALHGDHIKNYGDITKVDENELPNMDLLTYSFPCQDISVAGKQRGLSKDSGTRSSLLWECHRIIEAKKPAYLMMENVKNLVGKQNMPDFQAWLDTLTMLGYNNYWKVVNAKHCGVPQNRERVFCVSIRQDIDDGLFRFEEDFDNGIRLKHILETDVDEKYYLSDEMCKGLFLQMKGDEVGKAVKNQGNEFVKPLEEEGDSINMEHPNSKTRRGRVGVGQTLTTSCNQAVVEPNECNLVGRVDIKGNDQIKRIYNPTGISPTLTTMQGGHQEPKVYYQYRIRKLTPKECFRLMGLTDQEIEIIQATGISNSQQYKMAGNSIVVDAMKFLKNLQGE